MFGAVFWGKKLYMDPIWQMTSIWAMSWAMYGAVFWDKNHYMDPIFLCMVNYINLGYVLGYGLGYGLGCDLGKEPSYGSYIPMHGKLCQSGLCFGLWFGL